MQEQLDELQTQLAFQEHTIAELNDALTSQQRQIDTLVLQMKLLKESFAENSEQSPGSAEAAQGEKPPHY